MEVLIAAALMFLVGVGTGVVVTLGVAALAARKEMRAYDRWLATKKRERDDG